MSSFDEARNLIYDLEKKAKPIKFSYVKSNSYTVIEIKHISFDFIVNELDKVYKIRDASKTFNK
jgi:hypothetical protein